MKQLTRAKLGLLLLAPVLLFGCQSDSAEFAEGQMLTFDGVLETPAQVDTYEFIIISQGTVRIVLTELDTRIGETGEPVESQGMQVAFGRPNLEGFCIPTVSRLLMESEAISVFVPEGLYCITAFGLGSVYPTGTILDYTIELVAGI